MSTVSPAISGKVLTCATTAVATTTVQNIAESSFACTRTASTCTSGRRNTCPCFPLMANTSPLRLPTCGDCAEVQPRQSVLRAGRMFFGLKAPSRRGETATSAGRWRILFTVSPRSFMVLFFGRLCEPRAERAVSGACDRRGATRRREELNSFWRHAALRRPRKPQVSCLRWRSLGLGGVVSAVPNLLPPT
jgi:hypothetical protein